MALGDEASKKAIRTWIDQQYAELDQKSYYQLLGIERTDDDAAVRTAYYNMVARFHPDLYGDVLDADVRSKLVTLYTRLVEGYRILRDSTKRAAYAKLLDQNRLRWSMEDERKRESEMDIVNPNARRFFNLGRASLASGDAKSAAMNLRLALSVETGAGCAVIQKELTRAEALLSSKGGA